MRRLAELVAVAVASLSCAQSKPTLTGRAPDADRALAIADALLDDELAQSPEFVALLRPPGARYDTLDGASLAALAARETREDGWRNELAAIDRAALGDSPAALAYDIAVDDLDARKLARVCRAQLWSVAPMFVIGNHQALQVQLAALGEAQPVGNPELRAQALARFERVPARIDAQIADLREGLRLGYAQADVNVKQVIEQLDRLAQGRAEDSIFFNMARRDPDPAFSAALAELLGNRVLPALRRYRDFLAAEYLPRSRRNPAVASNPDGPACYRAALRIATTLPMEPKDVHALGLAELARVEAEMAALSAKSFGGADLKTVFHRFTTEPKFLQKNAAAVMSQATAAIARAKAALPRAFGLLPTSDVAVEPIAKFQERTAAPYYQFAALDGSRPGTYRVRLYEAEKQSLVLGESTAFHETVPGHHLQLNIANGRKDLPRIARFHFNSGFSEGWALYAERLADELGLYSDDAQRFGMLSNTAWRSCRLVVDSGIHALGWDRDRAISFLLAHTAMPESQAAQEVDRYISWPGQATAYQTGYVVIRRLRENAERTLGPRFNLRAFHDLVLEAGNVPLPLLERRIAQWVRARSAD
jgi:uncharacterized protein (DUF885 family)